MLTPPSMVAYYDEVTHENTHGVTLPYRTAAMATRDELQSAYGDGWFLRQARGSQLWIIAEDGGCSKDAAFSSNFALD